ncbi:hypothetical protein [Brevibacillus choshinensis]|uniref:hypothetical protein n=1 Tax=Brevibacillus choshinensis TaxID=54911 RepID=UPI002E24A138|nr:hypothetical protein [Brevibacillus choshinensis]MED4750744.1 hypothetical protein [Brevibacillus choshinensis]
MKAKSFLVTFLSLVLTTGVLYAIGHIFTIPFFMFHHEFTHDSNGFTLSSGSFVPLLIGLIVSFFAEKIYVYKYRQKMG